MGQEQSYSQSSVAQSSVNRYKDKYEQAAFRGSRLDYRSSDYDESYKRHKPRRSAESFKSDHTESSGYRSGSSACECRSSSSDYYSTSLYKNDHYRDINKELYKPVKIPKEKRYKLQLFDLQKEETKSARLKSYSYASEADKTKQKTGPAQKKTGIRNYTPKILSEDEQRKKVDNWI